MQTPAWLTALALALVLSGATAAQTIPLCPESPPRAGPLSPVAPRISLQTSRAPVDPPAPAVALRVRVPSAIAPGQELTYRLTAENTSTAAAHHVLVKVPLPANARYVSARPEPTEQKPALLWKLGTLKAGAKREIRLAVKPTGEDDVSVCARVQFEHGQCVRTKISKPGLQLTASGPAQAAKYDILNYKLEIRNTGKTAIRGIVIRDTVPKGLDFLNSKPSTTGDNPLVWKIDALAAGKSQLIEYQVVAKDTGSLTNNAVAEAGSVKKTASHTVKVGQPAVAVIITGPAQRIPGRDAVYRITVRNPGDMPATKVKVTDDLPEQIRFIRADAGGKKDGRDVRWELGTLKPGEVKRLTVTVRANEAGLFKNVCTVSADRGLLEQARTQTKFEKRTGLIVELDKSADPVGVDRETTCTMRLVNTGKVVEKDIKVVLTIGPGLKVMEAPGGKIDGNRVAFDADELRAGAMRAGGIRLKAEKAGEVKITAKATSKTSPGVEAQETVTVEDSAAKADSRTTARRSTKGRDRAAFRAAK